MNLRRWPRRWLAACLVFCAGHAQASLPVRIDAHGLTPEQIEATQRLLDEAARRMPPAWSKALDPRVTVSWDTLPEDVHGHAGARRLQLSRDLLEGAAADPGTSAALPALIHELAHFYDRTQGGQLSSDPRLLDLAGWQVAPMRFGLRGSRNRFTDRSPDSYELTSPEEFVAVNLEYFLLDPQYACRRPALFRHFADHFGWTPQTLPCASTSPYLQAEKGEPPLLDLDPARVHAVDYLLAEGNDKPMSRWGHSMLRLVICAPDREPGPECRYDLAHHRVLSFRAFVGDVQISNWRGLTGSYPSRLFLLSLDQVVNEYTKVELRGLRSVPLRLEPAEIAELLGRASQLHWSYDGRYYFLSNNCAVETFKLLHDGVPRLAAASLSSITPNGLMRRLEEAGIADASVLGDRDEAVRKGYYFEAASAHYQSLFEVASESLDLPYPKLDQWLSASPDKRRPWLEETDLRTGAALLLLEEAALRREELRGYDDIKRQLLARGVKDAVRDFLQSSAFLGRPATLLQDGGYGLPGPEEQRGLSEEASLRVSQWMQQEEAWRAEAKQWLPPARQAAIAGTEQNIAMLGDRLRELYRKEAGPSVLPWN